MYRNPSSLEIFLVFLRNDKVEGEREEPGDAFYTKVKQKCLKLLVIK